MPDVSQSNSYYIKDTNYEGVTAWKIGRRVEKVEPLKILLIKRIAKKSRYSMHVISIEIKRKLLFSIHFSHAFPISIDQNVVIENLR